MFIKNGKVKSFDGKKEYKYRVITSRFARFVRWLRRRPTMGGITVWNTVHICNHGDYSIELEMHEARHVAQWHHYGVVGFLVKYFKENTKNGYSKNKFEIDAECSARKIPYNLDLELKK